MDNFLVYKFDHKSIYSNIQNYRTVLNHKIPISVGKTQHLYLYFSYY